MASAFKWQGFACIIPGALGLLLSSVAYSAIPKTYVQPSPIIKGRGSMAGGEAGQMLGLVDLRHSSSKKNKAERLVLDFGRSDLKPLHGVVGYYHAELSTNPPRLVLELPLTIGSNVTEEQINRRIQGSLHIKKATMSFDRTAQSTILVFQLRSPVELRVSRAQNPKAPGKLALDFMPLRK